MNMLDFGSIGPKRSRLFSILLKSGIIGVPKGITTLNCVLEGKPIRDEIQICSKVTKVQQTTVPIRYLLTYQNRLVSRAVFSGISKFYMHLFPTSNSYSSHSNMISACSRGAL